MCDFTNWCGQPRCERKLIVAMLADGLDKVVEAVFPDGNIPVDIVDSAFVSLLSTYSIKFSRSDRVLMLNEHVEAMIANYHDHPDADLILQH